MKWYDIIAFIPILVLGLVAIAGASFVIFQALGWWAFIVIPTSILWFVCFILSAEGSI